MAKSKSIEDGPGPKRLCFVFTFPLYNLLHNHFLGGHSDVLINMSIFHSSLSFGQCAGLHLFQYSFFFTPMHLGQTLFSSEDLKRVQKA